MTRLHLTPDLAARLGVAPERANKYGAVSTTVDGVRFDSLAEAERYGELRWLEQAGQIACLAVHPRYEIVAASAAGKAVHYEADFSYTEGGREVVEDVKGGAATQTAVWKLKWRLLRERYPHLDARVIGGER